MPLTLSGAQRKAFQETLRALTRPFAFSSDVDWRKAVLEPVKRLFGADMVSMILIGAETPSFSQEVDSEATKLYLSKIAPLLGEMEEKRASRPLPVFNREQLWGPILKDYYRSAYYNEYIRPNRAFDAIGMSVPVPGDVTADTLGHHLLCHHDQPHPEGFGPDALPLLDMLYPAFEAGIRSWQEDQAQGQTLRVALDRSGARIGIYSREGRRLHQTPALTEVLMTDPQSEKVVEASAQVARTLSRIQGHLSTGVFEITPLPEEERPVQFVKTTVATYRLTASVAPRRMAGPTPLILVVADLLSRHVQPGKIREVPDLKTLRRGFSITKRQAEVAQLLALRYTNQEVADTLNISPHTARHHTQAVLEALGVSSRQEVAGRLRDL
jgi:DNA-binding CsgD family transcriptional regulator